MTLSGPRRRDIWDVAVVGGGIAGLTAALHAARRGLATALVETGITYGGQIATVNVLEDWPATGITSGVELAAALAGQVSAQGVRIFHGRVEQVVANEELFRVKAGAYDLRARRVIAASGAKLKSLRVPGEIALSGKGVSQCAYCDGSFFRAQDVVVIGGGDAALQQALVLSELCRSVTIMVRSSALRARRAYIHRVCGAINVYFMWDTEVEAIAGDGTVSGLQLRDVKTGVKTVHACSGVFPFIGVQPDAGFLPAAVTRDNSGHILTDERFCSSVPGLFAIGAVRSGYSGDLASAAGEAASAVASIENELAQA